MKKYRFHLLLAAFIFVYSNTSPYWLNHAGMLGECIAALYFIALIVGGILLFYNLLKCIFEKLKNKNSNLATLILAAVIAIAIFFPGGLIPKRLVYKGDPLVAFLDGVAGNNGYLVLYGNNTYEYNYAWAPSIEGKYKVKNDTIFFDSPKNNALYDFDFATLSNDKKLYFGKDSIAYSYLFVIKNELIE